MEYAIEVFDRDNRFLGRYDLDFVNDEAAIVHAQAMLPPRAGRFEVWQGTRYVTTVASPKS